MFNWCAKALFLAGALPAIVRATWRLQVAHRRHRLDELACYMRHTKPFRANWLRNAHWLAASLDRVLFMLPPFRFGPCFKRSLLLLDLWSRCGVETVFHLGMLQKDDQRHFHAWISCPPQSAELPPYQRLWSV